jgi:2-methylisocitrate lyase-like PEP mutase family enzyme
MQQDAPGRLREAMKSSGLLWGPGVYDGISARIADQVGFPLLYMTGAGTAASRIGEPDLGLTTASEMVENARNIQAVVHTPVIADADHGYGAVVNVIRTVHQYEQAGIAGIHIEDQAFPKRCGHLKDKIVIDRDEFRRRFLAAASERWNPDFVLIARTDARAGNGFEDAWSRIEDAFDAGADVGFVEAPESRAEVEEIARRANGRPMLLNLATNGKTPTLKLAEIRELGFKFAIWPAACMIPAANAIWASLRTLKEEGTDQSVFSDTPHDFFTWMGLDTVLDQIDRYSDATVARR